MQIFLFSGSLFFVVGGCGFRSAAFLLFVKNLELCGEETPLDEIPYWETINKYLERLDPQDLQDVVCQLVHRLVRSRAFAGARIRDKYWQVIVDGTQIHSSREKLDGKSLYRIHSADLRPQPKIK